MNKAAALALPLLLLQALRMPAPAGAATSLRILWFDWQPCTNLRAAAARYPDASVEVDCVPISTWYSTAFADMALDVPVYDIHVLDSQWIGEAAAGGLVAELTELMARPAMLAGDFFESALEAYGEYPPGSKKYWGVPFQGDVQMLVYRKDVYAAHNMSLPVSIEELADHAEFFKSSAAPEVEHGFASYWCSNTNGSCYDETPTIWHQFAWMHGGELWDPETYRIEGVVNSEANAESLRFTKRLFDAGPGNLDNGFGGGLDDFCSGRSALLQIWMGFAGAFTSLDSCNATGNLDDIGFYQVPFSAQHNLHVLSLGGMGVHVAANGAAVDEAINFVEWLTAREEMIAWARTGSFTTRKSVMADPSFLVNDDGDFVPYNAVFQLTFPLTKDFWNVPVWSRLLGVEMDALHAFLGGETTAEAALAAMAAGQQLVMDEELPCGPRCPVAYERAEALWIAMPALAVLGLLLVAASGVGTFVLRGDKLIKASGVPFMAIMHAGAAMMLVSVAQTAGTALPTDASCVSSRWLHDLGLVMLFAPLIVKSYRITCIFASKTLRIVKLSNRRLLAYTAGIVAPFAVFLAAWTAVSPPGATTRVVHAAGDAPLEERERVQTMCDETALAGPMFLAQLFVLLAGAWISYQVRNAPSFFQEAKWIGLATYNAIIYGAISQGIAGSLGLEGAYTVRSLAVMLTAPVAVGLVMGPKFVAVYTGASLDISTGTQNGTKVGGAGAGHADSTPGHSKATTSPASSRHGGASRLAPSGAAGPSSQPVSPRSPRAVKLEMPTLSGAK